MGSNVLGTLYPYDYMRIIPSNQSIRNEICVSPNPPVAVYIVLQA